MIPTLRAENEESTDLITIWQWAKSCDVLVHFLVAVALARLRRSTSKRSVVGEQRDRMVLISPSFLLSIAASAAPSKSLREK